MSDIKLLYAAATDEKIKNALIESHEKGDNLSFCFSNTCDKIHPMANNQAVSEGGAWIIGGGEENGRKLKSIKPHLDYFFMTMAFPSPGDTAEALLKFIKGLAPDLAAGFHVCGYDPVDQQIGLPLPRVYFVNTLSNEVTSLDKGSTGMMQHAANDYMKETSQLVAMNLRSLTLQDIIDYAVFAIKASAMYEKCVLLNNRIAGPIDVLVIRPWGMEWVSKKKLHAEGCNDTGIERHLWR
jgi:hypothetical protein